MSVVNHDYEEVNEIISDIRFNITTQLLEINRIQQHIAVIAETQHGVQKMVSFLFVSHQTGALDGDPS